MKSQKGQTLVEAIISLTVVIVVITAVVVAVITALSTTTNNSNQNSALNFSQEGIDIVRDTASSNFVTFQSSYPTGSYCMADDNIIDSVTTDCPATGSNITGNNGSYLRTLYVNQSGNNASGASKCSAGAYISSTAAWTDSKCKSSTTPNCHKVMLESCVSNRNALPVL